MHQAQFQAFLIPASTLLLGKQIQSHECIHHLYAHICISSFTFSPALQTVYSIARGLSIILYLIHTKWTF